jgi:RNA polymerase sigma-70 factor (ECF subfamily)
VRAEFERFYRENIDRIYRYVFFRVGRNRALAEDLVSDIFLKAFNAFDRYDESVSRSAWVYRIAHNHLANYYRDRKETVDLDDIVPVAVGERGEETMLRREGEMLVERALASLAAEERKLVTMKYLEGYSYEDMAPILEKSADALKVATHRAMKKLKTICSGLRGN